jgi:pfkB family carbohydrate kinase
MKIAPAPIATAIGSAHDRDRNSRPRRSRPARCAVRGMAVIDLTFRVERLPNPSTKFTREFFLTGAGCAANAAIARLGGQARSCGPVGDDEFGARVLDGLTKADVKQFVPGRQRGDQFTMYDHQCASTPARMGALDFAGIPHIDWLTYAPSEGATIWTAELFDPGGDRRIWAANRL